MKRRRDGPSLFYHHTTPSAAIGTGSAISQDEASPFKKSLLVVGGAKNNGSYTTTNTTVSMEDAEPVAPPEKIIKRPDSESCTSEGIESPIDGVSPNQPKTIETVSAS